MMALDLDIRLQLDGASQAQKAAGDLTKRMVDLRSEVSKFRNLKGIENALPIATQQQLSRMDQGISKTRALQEQVSAVRKELQAAPTSRLFELAERDARETLVDVDALNRSIQELRNELESPVNNRLAEATREVASPRPARGGGTSLSLAEQRRRQAFDVTDPVGDVDTGIAAFAGAFGQFGGAGIEKAARGISDVFAISEAAPRMVASLGTISPAMLGVIGTAGLLSVGFVALGKILDDTDEAIRKSAAAERARAQAIERTFEDLRSSDLDSQLREIDTLQVRLAAQQDALANALASAVETGTSENLNNFQRAYTLASALGSEFAGLDFGPVAAAREEAEKFNQEIAETEAEIQRINQEVIPILQARAEAERELLRLEESRDFGEEVAARQIEVARQRIETERQIANEIETLTTSQGRKRIEDLRNNLTDEQRLYEELFAKVGEIQSNLSSGDLSSDAAEELRGQLTVLEEQLDSLAFSIADDTRELELYQGALLGGIAARERETRLIEQFRDQAERAADALETLTDAQAALADFEGQLATEELNKRREASINAVYDGMLKQIDAEIDAAKAAEKVAQAQQKLSDLDSKRVEKLRDTNQEYYQEELDRLAAFRKSEARINDDFARDQRRRLEDLNDDLLEATANNDVVAFIQRQKEGSKELSRAAEDFGVEAVRRTEDYNAETARNQQDHLRDLLEINRQYHEQRLALQNQGTVAELSQLEQLQARRAEILAQRETSLEQFRQSLEQEALNRRHQSFIQQINAANEEYTRLNQLATTSGAIIGSNFMRSIINGAMMTQIQQAQQTVQNVGNSIRFPSFASGGISKEPTLARVGDTGPGWYEAHIPFRANQGLTAQDVAPYMSGGGSGRAVTVDMRGATFGSVTSPDELEKVGSYIVRRINEALAS